MVIGAVVAGCQRPAAEKPVAEKPPQTTLTATRNADGGYSFELSRVETAWMDQCDHERISVWGRSDAGAWAELELYYPDPNSKGGSVFVDDGPPTPSGKFSRCERGAQRRRPQHGLWTWSGSALAPDGHLERAAPGHYRVEVRAHGQDDHRVSQEFEIQ